MDGVRVACGVGIAAVGAWYTPQLLRSARRSVLLYLCSLRASHPLCFAEIRARNSAWFTLRHLATFQDRHLRDEHLSSMGRGTRMTLMLVPVPVLACALAMFELLGR